MRISKRLIATFLAVVMCLSVTGITAFAAEDCTVNEEMQELLSSLPSDATVVYQDDETVVYTTPGVASPTSMNTTNYDCKWVAAGDTNAGSFPIEKTFTGDGNITFKARSNTTSTKLIMTLYMDSSRLIPVTGGLTVYGNDVDVHVTNTVSSKRTFYVGYTFETTNPSGTFLMCWIYN